MSKKAVECFNKHATTSIEVEVEESKVKPAGRFLVRGLRDAIATKVKFDGDPSTIKIFGCTPAKTPPECGAELPEGVLPEAVVTFFFEVPCAQVPPVLVPRVNTVPRDIICDMWEGVGSLPTVPEEFKDNVHFRCRNVCVVTSRTKALKVAHIIPKKVFRDASALELLEWAPHDVNQVPNLLIMRDDVEHTFDNLLWCFVPASCGLPLVCARCGHPKCLENVAKGCQMHTHVNYTPFVAKELAKGALGPDGGKVVFLPTDTSRRALFMHAYTAHKACGKLGDLPPAGKYESAQPRGTPPRVVREYVEEQQRLAS